MGTWNALEELRYCPILGGGSVIMTEESWAYLCNRWQDLAHEEKGKRSRYCLVCRGSEIPAGVRFRTLPEMAYERINGKREKEEEMAEEKRVNARCAWCGDTKKVKELYGKQTCSVCEIMCSSVRIRPKAVVMALLELNPGHMPNSRPVAAEYEAAAAELAAIRRHVGIADGLQLLQYVEMMGNDNVRMRNTIRALREELGGDVVEPLEKKVATLRYEHRGYVRLLDMVAMLVAGDREVRAADVPLLIAKELDGCAGELAEINRLVDELEGQVDSLAEPVKVVTDPVSGPGCASSRLALVLELAIGVVDGRISGLSGDHLRSLLVVA